jgi:signal transduction histidine kinase
MAEPSGIAKTSSTISQALGNESFVRKALRRAFVVPIVVMLGFVAILGLEIRHLVIETHDLERTDEIISTGQKTLRLLVDMETGLRGYLLTGLGAFLEPYLQALPLIDPSLARLDALVSNQPAQRARIEQVRGLEKSWLARSDEQMLRRREMAGDNAIMLEKKQSMDRIRATFDEFLSGEQQQRHQIASAVQESTLFAALSAIVLALMVGGSFGYYSRLQLARLDESYREQQIRLDEARSAAEAANLAKDSFLAMLSHELRNPLNTLMLSAQSLRRGEALPENKTRALMTIERSVTHLEKMIADLLDSSRIVSGKLALELRPLDPAAIVNHALDTVRASAEAKQIRLMREADANVPTIAADPDRIQQVLWNLLSNAIKFTPIGGEVGISLHASPDAIAITVRDNGEGIAAENLPLVFGRFWQNASLNGRTRGGLGLGLSIARSLTELHGGTLEAYSEGPDRGSIFTVTLPLHRR